MRVREARNFRGMSQSELARRIAVHRTTLNRWETDKADIPLRYAKGIAKAVDMSLNDIFLLEMLAK